VPSVPVYKQKEDNGPAVELTRAPVLGGLLHGELATDLLPTPCGDLSLFFGPDDVNAITDLWMAMQWGA
jgi:hypothetical protein